MSQLDLNHLSRCSDVPTTTDDLIPNWQSMQEEPASQPNTFLPLFPSANLFKSLLPSSNAQNRSTHLLQPDFFDQDANTCSDFDEGVSEEVREDGRIQLQEIKDGDVFECRCSTSQQEKCPFCMNAKLIPGNSSIVRFLQYIIAFKLGAKPSYASKTAKRQEAQSLNASCSNNHRKSLHNFAQSNRNIPERSSLRPKKLPKSEFAQQLNTLIAVHDNYCCDICQTAPIIGSRYHCSECEDYDECQQCHTNSEHQHLMQRLDRSGRGRQLQGMIHMLEQPLGRRSLRAPPSIKCLADPQAANNFAYI